MPSLGISSPVVDIPMTGDGVLTPPDDPRTLGWWSGGAAPGAALGSSLITGHTVHSGGGDFDDLEQVRPGAVVRVQTSEGVIEYAVTDVEIYRKLALADEAQRVFSQSVPGRLALITCEDWNGEAYESNVVVLATPVS